MKCSNCGYESNKKEAKFCKKCGADLFNQVPVSNNENSTKRTLIICSTIVIIFLLIVVSFVAVSYMENSNSNIIDSTQAEPVDESNGEWVLIDSYSGKGSGKESISVPSGKIMIKISAFPIKNYATNHLYVSGSNGVSTGVDWGSNSAVATRSDSVSFTSSRPVSFTIDYYETVSWQVQVYQYK